MQAGKVPKGRLTEHGHIIQEKEVVGKFVRYVLDVS
jgi:hypothetical protein